MQILLFLLAINFLSLAFLYRYFLFFYFLQIAQVAYHVFRFLVNKYIFRGLKQMSIINAIVSAEKLKFVFLILFKTSKLSIGLVSWKWEIKRR